ncbi:MAG: hypothetical protein ACREDD_10620 [Methylocella sp.]
MNTDLLGGLDEAKTLFESLTEGQTLTPDVSDKGTTMLRATDCTQLRINTDGSVRIDRPIDINGRTREKIHFNPIGTDNDP